MKVRNMANKNGRAVLNQFIIEDLAVKYFVSYDTIIAKKCGGVTTLDRYFWDCSKTTGKYRNQFLGEKKKETQAKIDSGEYVLADLN